ncbi:MAG: pyridoxal-phosphate dependent enzyme [Gemmatimonadota bacterium]|nr:pyridoxal-phosphate dependent enzyme [Gemmatimonadota bacterium]
MPTLHDVREARSRIEGRVHRTPLLGTSTLAERAGVARLDLKCESFQKTGSFKVRGVLNKLSQLESAARARGVVTVSAGNHAQALAWGARAAGIRCTVVMPAAASRSKVEASRGYGAEVIQHGTNMEAFAKASELAKERGLVFVHPFDDEQVIAGAGTVALELLEQTDAPDVIVVPVGGGGLISGIAIAAKEMYPAIRVVGVEPDGAAAMRRSLDAGRAVRLDSVATIADGLGAPMAGEITFEIVRRYVDDVVLVSDEEIAGAMRILLERTKLLAEGAGAAATAALLSRRLPVRPADRVVAILSGGNVDLERLEQVIS